MREKNICAALASGGRSAAALRKTVRSDLYKITLVRLRAFFRMVIRLILPQVSEGFISTSCIALETRGGNDS